MSFLKSLWDFGLDLSVDLADNSAKRYDKMTDTEIEKELYDRWEEKGSNDLSKLKTVDEIRNWATRTHAYKEKRESGKSVDNV